jgi:hypothetical protein
MLFEFLAWWYGPGWLSAWKNSFEPAKKVQMAFSIDVLLKTLFSPWKRIVVDGGRSIDEKFRAAMDNLVSRVIGFCVRIIILVTAVVLIALTAAACAILALVWPLLPLIGVGLVFWGVLG